jgi:hypothetical protein
MHYSRVDERDREAVYEWVEIRASETNGPVHVHFDELFTDYDPSAAVALAAETFEAAVLALANDLASIKPILSIPLRETERLIRRAPDISRLRPLLHRHQPPSLNLVRRDAFGRVAMLAENYELRLRLDEHAHGGATVWFYRTNRLPDDEEWSRYIYIEHFVEVGFGQRVRTGHGGQA